MRAEKPFSAACERNREPILAVLRAQFAERRRVLEIGSGTGQHAAHFARHLPHLTWQASDRAGNLAGIAAWLDEAALANTPAPLPFDVSGTWPAGNYDAIFSANTLHIMSWREVELLFGGLPAIASADARLVVYGPFNYGGAFTSASNEQFDRSLKARDACMGIRDIESVHTLAAAAGFRCSDDVAMPANNRCVVWQRGHGA